MIPAQVLQRILGMKKLPWKWLLRFLQLACLFLAVSAFLLISYGETGAAERLTQAKTLQELSQLALLGAVLLPVCLEDLSEEDRKTPPGSSGR